MLRAQRDRLIREAKEEEEAYQMYLGFLERDKELHQLLIEIHEMKCHFLVCMGEGGNLSTLHTSEIFSSHLVSHEIFHNF